MGKRGVKKNYDKERLVTAMFLSGATQEEIGKQIGCTKQNVNLILKGNGISRMMGGVCLKTTLKRARDSEKREKKFLELYGLKEREFKTPELIRLHKSFLQQKHNAQYRGIEWELKFSEWLDVWGSSGKIPFRGQGKNYFCMGRIGDIGAYKKGNVYICTHSQNAKDIWANKSDMKIRTLSGRNYNRTHCRSGHERKIHFYVTPGGRTVCRKCSSIATMKYYKKSLAIKKNMAYN